jgi:Chromo (CHRromatin Organisation MOdifier) domain
MSSVFRQFNRMMKQKQRPTLSYRPQGNGKQERCIQTLIWAIKCYIADRMQTDWDEFVCLVEFALNTSVSLQFKQTSFYLVHGWEARSQLEAMVPPKDDSLKETEALKWRMKVTAQHEQAMACAHFIQEKLMEERAAKANRDNMDGLASTVRTSYQPGELVWLYHDLVKKGLVRKLSHLWHGPYRIKERVDESVYRLDFEAAKVQMFPLVHVSRLKAYISRHRRPTEKRNVEGVLAFDEALLPEDSWVDNEDGDYEVEEIRDVRYKQRIRNGRRQREYLVKWLGYADPTWEPEENLSCTALLYEFDIRRAYMARREAAQTAEEEKSDGECAAADDGDDI